MIKELVEKIFNPYAKRIKELEAIEEDNKQYFASFNSRLLYNFTPEKSKEIRVLCLTKQNVMIQTNPLDDAIGIANTYHEEHPDKKTIIFAVTRYAVMVDDGEEKV